jgi:hypothetical protein
VTIKKNGDILNKHQYKVNIHQNIYKNIGKNGVKSEFKISRHEVCFELSSKARKINNSSVKCLKLSQNQHKKVIIIVMTVNSNYSSNNSLFSAHYSVFGQSQIRIVVHINVDIVIITRKRHLKKSFTFVILKVASINCTCTNFCLLTLCGDIELNPGPDLPVFSIKAQVGFFRN